MMHRSRLRKVSKKRAKANQTYFKVRNQYLKSHRWCEVMADIFCENTAKDVHHVRGRGKYLCDPRWFMAVCRYCHRYIHDNVKWAREKGFLEKNLTA